VCIVAAQRLRDGAATHGATHSASLLLISKQLLPLDGAVTPRFFSYLLLANATSIAVSSASHCTIVYIHTHSVCIACVHS
jgi:hypothetical protein